MGLFGAVLMVVFVGVKMGVVVGGAAVAAGWFV